MDNLTESNRLSLFQGYGVELEYMIVDENSLDVKPITDKIMHAISGEYSDEVERGDISWSNELALHVIELKTSTPVKSLEGLHLHFQNQIMELNDLLKGFKAKLMPSAMHPWMDPIRELRLWPHAYNPIYETYNRIFNCTGHGWANLQSSHLNLPFNNDDEFARLHAAIRFLLPIMPAIAASSPIIEGQATAFLDNRLIAYLDNSKIIPSITGKVIPEASLSQQDYLDRILNPMYRDIAPYDPEGILQHEWLNSRGAIARFDRYTIEIRVLDVQECPEADLEIIKAIVQIIKELVHDKWGSVQKLNSISVESLFRLFMQCAEYGEEAIIDNLDYLNIFGIQEKTCKAKELWNHLAPSVKTETLATRIKKRWLKNPTKQNLRDIYSQLCYCLESGTRYE